MKHHNITFLAFLIVTGLITIFGLITYHTAIIIAAILLLGNELCDVIYDVHNRN